MRRSQRFSISMITNTNHLSFTVSNLDASVSYYRDVLGLEVLDISEREGDFAEQATGVAGAHLKIAYVNCFNTRLELIEYKKGFGNKPDTAVNNVGSAHVCFDVDNIMDFVLQTEKKTQTKLATPIKIPKGPNKDRLMLYMEDPDGNTIELISNDVYD